MKFSKPEGAHEKRIQRRKRIKHLASVRVWVMRQRCLEARRPAADVIIAERPCPRRGTPRVPELQQLQAVDLAHLFARPSSTGAHVEVHRTGV